MVVSFKQVDVFTDRPFEGNPVAVVMDGGALDDSQMQLIATWTNLSETTFVLPPVDPQADYRVRIFTPQAELPFAGHPTIGTAHALLESGIVKPRDGQLIQECKAGLVKLTVTARPTGKERIAFELPQPKFKELSAEQTDELECILGAAVMRDIPVKVVSVGVVWTVAQLENAAAVLSVKPHFARMAEFDRNLGATGVTIFGTHGAENSTAIEVRSFAPSQGINEDPVCGSGNGSVAAYLLHSKKASNFGPHYTSSQGVVIGRDGRVEIDFAPDGTIRVGGSSVTCIAGHIQLPDLPGL